MSILTSPALQSKSLWSSNPIPRGCVLYLPFWSPGLNGSAFKSADPYRHECTASGTLLKANGRYLNGADEYIRSTAAALIAAIQTLTVGSVVTWARFDDFTGNHCIFGAADSGDADSRVLLYIKSTDSQPYGYCAEAGSNKYNNAFATGALSVDTWYNFVFTQDGTSPDLYLDTVKYDLGAGGADETAWFNTVANIDDVVLGAGHTSAGYDLDHKGYIGEVALYDRLLSQDEVTYYRRMTRGRYQ